MWEKTYIYINREREREDIGRKTYMKEKLGMYRLG
jgi:hypothetical protein